MLNGLWDLCTLVQNTLNRKLILKTRGSCMEQLRKTDVSVYLLIFRYIYIYVYDILSDLLYKCISISVSFF